ncbi:Stage V sporulation protein D [bioreactor metagenome]|uniref:Stage V sporulation protein D n=1 Tax=bioreactor metagenome TaxID=1076179 RepID=A0A645GMY0_9ZZZZ
MLILVDEPKVASAFGSTVVGPIIKTVMKNCLQYLGIQPQYTEEEKATIKENIEVPKVTGLSIEEAKKQLKAAGLSYSIDGIGTVTNQLPKAGEKVTSDTTVLLYTNKADPAATTVEGD